MAFLVSVALFSYFWLVGFSILGLLYRRDDLVRSLLIAPAVGLVVTLYSNYLLSRSGLAIGSTARPLGAALLVASIVLLWWRRPLLPGRRGIPFVLIMALALVASGWPLFMLGFDWLAHFNPDAGNYILDTDRLQREAYLPLPDTQAWLRQADWSAEYAYYPAIGARIGTDLLFAWVVAVFGIDEPAGYMPLIVAMHAAAITAATALIGTAHRFARLLTGGLLAVSAMSSVGVALQLLGQEQGLVCLSLSCVLLLTPFYRLSRRALLRHVLLAGIAGAGFVLSYPEMLPFLGLGFILYHGIRLGELRRYWRQALGAAAATGVLVCLLVLPDVLGLLKFLFQQAASSTSRQRYPELFPYFLMPNGVAATWGLRSYLSVPSALVGSSVGIALGIGLTAGAAIGAAWLAWRREAAAVILVVMVPLAAVLVVQNSGFGIFKLSMYAQPFLMMIVVLSLCRLFRVLR